MSLRNSTKLGVGALVLLAASVFPSPSQPVEASHLAAVSAGIQHSCLLTTEGGVKCWGRNQFGQLGNGTTTDSAVPVDAVGLESGVAAVAAGGVHTCAVTTAGSVKCWGRNWYGQLGNGTTTDSGVPVDVVGLGGEGTAISAGFKATCAITSAGGVMCWGLNSHGQLGDGTTTSSATPVDVVGLDDGVVGVSLGEYHACALSIQGGVMCWGNNGAGQLGAETSEVCELDDSCSTTPVAVLGLESGVAAVTAGMAHTCALTETGGVKCWGDNQYGEVGDGTSENSATPVDVTGLASGVASIDGEYAAHTCAVTTAGGLKCWGNNFFGQLGDGTGGPGTNRTTPVDVLGMESGVDAVSAGGFHTCALKTDGGLVCWGNDFFNQLGDSDGDGCTDLAEHGSDPEQGGQRNPYNFWDFYDTPDADNARNGSIDLFTDVMGVASRFGANDDEGSAPTNRDTDPLSPPDDAPAYHPAFDRGALTGPNPWDLGPADGGIDLFIDIFGVAIQFGHDCTGVP